MLSSRLWTRLKNNLEKRTVDFEGACGICVEDLITGEGFSVNGQDIFPTASTIKMHVLTQLFCRAERSEVDLMQRIRFTPALHGAGSGVIHHMEGEPELSLEDIAILMILVSDNSATNLCIDFAGIPETNSLMRKMGLKATSLRRKMMDTDAIDRGEENIATPEECVMMLKLLHTGKPSSWVAEKVLNILGKPKKGLLNSAIPSGLAVANKPGGMDRVRCDSGIVYLPNRPYAIAVMTSFGIGDPLAQEKFVIDVAKTVHQTMTVLDSTNDYGLAAPISTPR